MNKPLSSFTTPTGEELVVITRADYDQLVAGLDGDAAEDAGVARIVRQSDAAIARGEDVAIPEQVWESIESGVHPVLAIRTWRDLTQMHVAFRAGITQGYLSQVESGAKQPTVEVLTKLSQALGVPVGLLIAAGPA